MIEELRIQGLGVIDSADVQPSSGLTCLTGETGAGKTMVLTAVALLRGERCPPGLIRGERARVEAIFSESAQVADLVEEFGGEVDDDELIVARVIPAEGRSRTFVGGATVAASVATRVTESLVAVHGQADQWRLRSGSAQRALLDEYAGEPLNTVKVDYRELFERVTRIRSELEQAQNSAETRRAEIADLRMRLEQVQQVDPQPGEDDLLAEESERLANVEDLVHACATAHAALAGTEDDSDANVVTRLGVVQRALTSGGQYDGKLSDFADRAAEIMDLVSDLARDIASKTSDYEADPARLAWVHQRRADLSRVTRALGGTVDQVRAWALEAEQRLAELEDDGFVDRLADQLRQVEVEAADLAGQITGLRLEAAGRLMKAVTAELKGLAMPDATISITVEQREDPDGLDLDGTNLAFGPEGVDQVAFLLSAHRGGTPTPLGQGASGGELSRVMLAIEVCLASSRSAPTMIFDEIDAGVGGKAAVEIGRRLARLARWTQVIVVTHLPQVAAFADTHLRVHKGSVGQVSATSVERVEGHDRRRELARMLAGQEQSEHALAHADELLALAAQEAASTTLPA